MGPPLKAQLVPRRGVCTPTRLLWLIALLLFGVATHPGRAAAASTYASVVLADHPSVYYRLADHTGTTGGPGTCPATALDSSGNSKDAAYAGRLTCSEPGALVGDSDASVATDSNSPGLVFSQSGSGLPAGSSQRTLEAWVHDVSGPFTLFSYGDVAGGHGFAVSVAAEGASVTVSAGTSSVPATTAPGFNRGWHLVDVTYDGSRVEIYQDGQIIGGGLLGATATVTPGQGLQVGASFNSNGLDIPPYELDEVAIYPTALSLTRIDTHWTAQASTPPGISVIGGTALFGGGGAAVGARVQACPTSGGPCQVDPTLIDSSGGFRVLVPNGTYTVTVFPPAPPPGQPRSPSGPQTITNVTVPQNALNLTATFTPPGGLPPGVTLSSPSAGMQKNVVPGVNWGEPSTVTVDGQCKGGFGAIGVQAVNTSTGQLETRGSELVETPAGSGTYVAQIPPLAPLHGLGNMNHGVMCPTQRGIFPAGGSSSGGTSVLVGGSGFTGVKAVSFGLTPAASFRVLQDNVIEAVSPAGSGSVPIAVTTADGRTTLVGNFAYFGVAGLDTTSGSSDGGTAVKIRGYGFRDVKDVAFGIVAASSFEVVSPTEVDAVAPPGVGTVDVQVITDTTPSDLVTADYFTYHGGAPSLSRIVEGTGPDAPLAYASKLSTVGQSSGEFSSLGHRLRTGIGCILEVVGLSGAGSAIAALLLSIPTPPTVVAGVVLAIAGTVICLSAADDGDVKIDPSGTVVDTNGNAVASATATLLGQSAAGGPFSLVDASSGAIEPAINPETPQDTNRTAEFHWDALAGSYEVEASAPGCHAPGNASQPEVLTSPFVIPPPAVGLLLTLQCPGSTPQPPGMTSLAPAVGPASGGNQVDILDLQGRLAGVSAVHFGGKAAGDVKVLSPYAVEATAPAGSSTVDVTVTTPGGTSPQVDADKYSYSTPSAPGPVVTSVNPADGSKNVSAQAYVFAVFDEAMDHASTAGAFSLVSTSDNRAVAGQVVFFGDAVPVFTPSSPLVPGTQYRATISTAATDASGNHLAVAKSWSFTTGTQPVITSVSPADRATAVALNANVLAVFNEAMDHASTSGAFSLVRSSDHTPVAGRVSFYVDTVPIFTPSSPLAPGIEYTATISTAAKASNGIPLASAKTWSFVTAGKHSAATRMSCSPGTFAPGDATVCKATVTNTASSGPSTPTGTVDFSNSGNGRFFGSPCQLSGGSGSASCTVFFTSLLPGGQGITARYSGDGAHSGSSAGTFVNVAVPTSTSGCVVGGHGRLTAANGDQASFRALLKASPPRGAEFYRDNGPKSAMRVVSRSIDAVTCTDDATKASVFGKAKINGAGSVEYRIDVQLTAWAWGKDSYRIRLSDGYDSGAQQIRHGDVDIHRRNRDHHHHDPTAGHYEPGVGPDGG